MGQRFGQACFLVLLMLLTPLSGCFGQQDRGVLDSPDDVVITPPVLTGGVFQGVTVTADVDLSVYVPYLIQNPDNGFVQNSTVVDLRPGESIMLSVLAPPRTDTALVMVGEFDENIGRFEPLRNRGERGFNEAVMNAPTTLVSCAFRV